MGEGLRLPVHGFVLAGGKSSRMGVDKATLDFCGVPMVEIAVRKLREFCAEVSIVGNRDDLNGYAPVVREPRLDAGPAAGIEAGLMAARQPWAMFVPVDVPLVPAELLRMWAAHSTLEAPDFERSVGPLMGCSLYTKFGAEPAFAILRRETSNLIADGLDVGERRLDQLLGRMRSEYGHARYLRMDASWFGAAKDAEDLRFWFSNVNTPEEFDEAEAWARHQMATGRVTD